MHCRDTGRDKGDKRRAWCYSKLRRRGIGICLWGITAFQSQEDKSEEHEKAKDKDNDEFGQSWKSIGIKLSAEWGCWADKRGIHNKRIHKDTSKGIIAFQGHQGQGCKGEDSELDCRLQWQEAVFRGEIGAGNRDAWSCVLSKSGYCKAERFQEQWICKPDRRERVWAVWGKSNDRVERGFKILWW